MWSSAGGRVGTQYIAMWHVLHTPLPSALCVTTTRPSDRASLTGPRQHGAAYPWQQSLMLRLCNHLGIMLHLVVCLINVLCNKVFVAKAILEHLGRHGLLCQGLQLHQQHMCLAVYAL